MSTHRWLWRLRRNPLRRRSDVAEAWIGLALGALAVVGAPAAGVVAAWGAEAELHHEVRADHTVSAVLLQDATTSASVSGGTGYGRVPTQVRWTASDGATRTGVATVPEGLTAGATTTVWLDNRGRPTEQPPGSAEVDAQAWTLGVVVGGAACGVSLAVRRAVRAGFDRRRAAEWEREWAEVGPQWRGLSA
jgi:hypothetical protein